jgi:hypothetical protein
MAHAARIEDGIVREVIVVPDDLDETESDAAIEAYIHGIGLHGEWIRTSYNGNIRGRYAGIGFTYDADLDEFVAPEAPAEDEAP